MKRVSSIEKQAELMATIEALLFVSGDEGLLLEELSDLLSITKDQIISLLRVLSDSYEQNNKRGLKLIQTGGRYKMVTKETFADIIQNYARAPFNQTLTRPVLETLAIIAYRQPITRLEIEEIRGVQVAANLQKLKAHQLIEPAGHLDQPGRPLIYRTTDYFLDYFGINHLGELPELPESDFSEQINLFEKKDDQEGVQDE